MGQKEKQTKYNGGRKGNGINSQQRQQVRRSWSKTWMTTHTDDKWLAAADIVLYTAR